MKKVFLNILAILCLAVTFTSCNEKDDSVTISYQYKMRVGLGTDYKVGSETPGLNYVLHQTQNEVKKLNESLQLISVTGSGKDAASANQDAKDKAIIEYSQRAEQIFVALLNIQSSFASNCQLEADNIKLEVGHWVKLNTVLYLVENYEPGDIIKEEGNYKMEAIGGTDYSLVD